MHDCALRGEQVGQRVADRHPAAAARVEGSGRVGRHEFEVDAQAVERVAVAVRLAGFDHGQEHLVQPGGCEVEVEEAGTGDLDPFEMRGPGPLQLHLQLGGHVAGLLADLLRQLQCDIGGEVAVPRILRWAQLDAKLEQRLAQLDAKLEQRIAELRAEMQVRIAELKSEMHAGFARVDQRFAELETRLTKRLFAFWIAQAATTAGLVLGVVKLLGR